MTGISEFPEQSQQEWISITGNFISNFFSIPNSAVVQDLETTITVTDVIGVPGEHRRSLRQLQKEPSHVIAFYTQEFLYRTPDDDTVDAKYLATMPLTEAIGRESYSTLLQNSGGDGLAGVTGVSPVEIPAAPLQGSGVDALIPVRG
jgi:hypothetical protein